MKSISRLVRVFISSTFRDFIQERDELVKMVFPELRRRCKERFVELLEVDLRWGITEEQAKGGETLRICLEEIDRCRPSAPVFFVGLLGERYGWIPPKEFFTKEVLEDPNLGWVKEHIEGKSVTELEILHGVLRNEAMRDKAFFYFRNDGYQDRHWQEIESHHQKISPPVSKEDFTNAKSEHGQASDDQKQSELKRVIRDASLAWDPRNYETPEEMGSMVLEDLWMAIDRVFSAGAVPDENERHRLEHDAFGQSRTKGYVERAGLFETLDTLLSIDELPIIAVAGESGGGKSALLAAWLDHVGPSAPLRQSVHYIGGTPESSSAKSIVFRLMNQIRSWGVVSEPVPDDLGKAVEALPEWLARAAAGQDGGLLLVLDALNQLESSRDRSLWWLPKQMPPGVHLVVSTLPGEAEDELRARGWLANELRVPPLNDQERKQIIAGYLGRFTKQLESGLVDRLARAPQSSNPLFLRVVLDELRIRARHEELGPMLEKMLEANDPSELFIQVLKNLEEFDKERKNLVREAMGYLAVARRGLSEDELLQLLSDDAQPSSNPLPRHYWSPLYLALEDSLVSRNGQLSFFHDYLQQAAEREYLDEDWERKRVHGRLGEVAEAHDSERFSPALRRYSLAHGAWHLAQAGEEERLWGLLQDEKLRKSQLIEFNRADEAVDSLKEGIELFSLREGESADGDARLSWLALRCGGLAQEARIGVRAVFDEFRRVTGKDSVKIAETLRRLQILDEQRFFQAVQLLLAIEVQLNLEAGQTIPRATLSQIVESVRSRVAAGTPVTVGGIDQFLAHSLPPESYKEIAGVTFEKEWRYGVLVGALSAKKQWEDALALTSEIKEELDRSRGFVAITEALCDESVAISQRVLIGERLYGMLSAFRHAADKNRAAHSLAMLFASCVKDCSELDCFQRAVDLADLMRDPGDKAAARSEIALQLSLSGAGDTRSDRLLEEAWALASLLEDPNKKDNALRGVLIRKARSGKWGQLLEQVQELSNPDNRMRLLCDLARIAQESGDAGTVKTICAQALDIANDPACSEKSRPSHLARIASSASDAGANQTSKQALKLAQVTATKSERPCFALLDCAQALAEAALGKECASFVEKALECPVGEVDPRHLAQYLSNVAVALEGSQDRQVGKTVSDAFDAVVDKISERKWRSETLLYHSTGLALAGNIFAAGEVFAKGIEIGATTDDDAYDWPSMLSGLAVSAHIGKQLALAESLFNRSLSAAVSVAQNNWRDRALSLVASRAARVGELEFAIGAAGKIKGDGWLARSIAAVAPRLIGGRGAANTRRHFASLSSLTRKINEPEHEITAWAGIAKAKHEAGDKAGALKTLKLMQQPADSALRENQGCRVRCAYARALAWCGQKDEAISQLEEILEPLSKEDKRAGEYERSQAIGCLVEIGEIERAAEEALKAVTLGAGSSRTLALVGTALARSGDRAKSGKLFNAAGKHARDFDDHVTVLGQYANVEIGEAVGIASSTTDPERRCKALVACLEASGEWPKQFDATSSLQQALSDVGSLDAIDQSDWMGAVAQVLLKRGFGCSDEWIARFKNAAKSENAFDFLLTLEFQDHDPELVLPWIRGFMRVCPSRGVIGKKLVCDLISTHLRSANPSKAEVIAKACPQIGLPKEVFS